MKGAIAKGMPVPVHAVLNNKEIKVTSSSDKKHNNKYVHESIKNRVDAHRVAIWYEMEIDFAEDTGIELTDTGLDWRIGEGCDADSGVAVISSHSRVDGRLDRNDSVVTTSSRWVFEDSDQGLSRSGRTFSRGAFASAKGFVRIRK
jgi:hypothetical protein